MAERRIGALIFAGGEAKEGLAGAGGSPHKALADIHGKPMATYVWRELERAETVCDLALVSVPEVREALEVDEAMWSPAREDVVENILAGAELLADRADLVVLVSCDIPLATAEGFDAFVRASLDADVALCYAFLSQRACVGRFADVKKTWVYLREGVMAGGNVAAATPKALIDKQDRIREAFALRKSPLALAKRLGFAFAMRVLFGRYCPFRVSISAIEERVSRMLGFPARAILLDEPGLGIDVDAAQDLEFVRALLAPETDGD